MTSSPEIAVSALSFSKNEQLKARLLERFPNARFNGTGGLLQGSDLVRFVGNAPAVIAGTERFDESVLRGIPTLKFISKYGVGLDNIDMELCHALGIQIGWTGGVNRVSVSEMTLGFMLGLIRNLYPVSQLLSAGNWVKNGGRQLTGKTIGIIGVGHIGKDVVRLLAPFHCRILVNDIADVSKFCAETGAIHVEKDVLFRESDIVSLHVPRTAETLGMVDESVLSIMRADAFLINTCRGGVVVESALKSALVNGQIAGAALDVYENEPPTDLEFLALPNLYCTPHIGGNAIEAVLAMGDSAIDHLTAYFQPKDSGV
ncbi:MAG: phosphoglycerate dehydrogenase [bacterium]|nr:phosphoglycerate dehydrogenase [bacterium]